MEALHLLAAGASASAAGWAATAAAALLLGLAYYYLVLPMDWTRDIAGVGFHFSNLDGRTRTAVVRAAQQRRKMGNMLPVFPNGWFAVIESCRLKRGEVKLVNALGQNLAVFRGQSGKAHVLDAYCPHNGANMAVGGRVLGECLECPFHEWRFDGLDGKCTSIAYADKVPDFARVRSWECVETNASVFIWHHAEGEPPSWSVVPIPAVVDGSWTYVGRNEFNIVSHIQDIPENAADPPHLSAIHRPGMWFPWLSHHVWDIEWRAETDPEKQHVAKMRLHHKLAVFHKYNVMEMEVNAHQIGPAIVELYVRTALGPITIVQTVLPLGPLLQRVIHRMYCPLHVLPLAKFIMIGESVMFERDICVWNHKQYLDKPILIREDRYIAKFRRWYSQFYSEHSPKHTFRKDTMEW